MDETRRRREEDVGRKEETLLPAALIVLAAAALLISEGRVLWCSCGSLTPFSGGVWSPHNSQHLFDPYTFTHILHGMILYGISRIALPRAGMGSRFLLALGIEGAWEVFENSDFTIERFRAATIAVGYTGDSVANSLGDMAAAALGFFISRRLGPWRTVALFFTTEIILLFWIHDGLVLNILMLIVPMEGLRAWQMG